MSWTPPPQPFPHWMLKEIFEQPATLAATLARYAGPDGFHVEAVAPIREWLAGQRHLLISASGSSRHAGLVAEMLIEAVSTLLVDVEFASEYGLREVRARSRAGVIVISQSGETADTLAALRLARQKGNPTLAITNVPTSTMAQEATVSMPVEAGRERAIPATKSFTGQLLVLDLLALLASESTGSLDREHLTQQLSALHSLPALVESQLPGWQRTVESLVPRYSQPNSFLFLGRGVHYPIAREGALKLKESAYVHAEGYPSGELKHGPNALVSEGTPLVMIATVDPASETSLLRYHKTVALMRDMRSQGADILALGNTGDNEVESLASAFIPVQPATESVLAISEVVPLQLLAYYLATARGIDVDRPRNLVKAVVAE